MSLSFKDVRAFEIARTDLRDLLGEMAEADPGPQADELLDDLEAALAAWGRAVRRGRHDGASLAARRHVGCLAEAVANVLRTSREASA